MSVKTAGQIAEMLWDKFDFEYGLSDQVEYQEAIDAFVDKIETFLSSWQNEIEAEAYGHAQTITEL